MIKLGLDKIIVKRHDPSLAVQQALSETVAWCLSKTPQIDQLRSWELDPSVILRDPRLEESSVEVRVGARRESCRRAIQSINEMRSTLVHHAQLEIPSFAVAETRGKLLCYEPLETVEDGASAYLSRGFFDMEDAPPWDTWFLYSKDAIFSWVPDSLVQNAQAGIDANIVDCIHWCDWSELSKSEQFSA
jgi:hypothetical protein